MQAGDDNGIGLDRLEHLEADPVGVERQHLLAEQERARDVHERPPAADEHVQADVCERGEGRLAGRRLRVDHDRLGRSSAAAEQQLVGDDVQVAVIDRLAGDIGGPCAR